MKAPKGLKTINAESFYAYLDAVSDVAADWSDGAWQQAIEDGVTRFNKDNGTSVDPYAGFIWYVKETAAQPASGN